MKKYCTFYFILLATSTLYSQIPKNYYFIVPGTMSYRLDASENPELATDGKLVRGRYYGADVNGAMTPFNSSQYKDFTLFHHPDDSNYITDPHQVDKITPNNRWLLNYRIAYPSTDHYDYDTASREQLFPLMVFMHGAGERADCWGSECYGPEDPRMYNNDHNVRHGGSQHLKAINANPSDPGHWPGFVVFPQNKNGYNPGTGLGSYTARVIALVETLVKKYPIDPNRIYINGLSNGANGIWMLLHSRPDLFAAAAPMSGYRIYGIFDTTPVAVDTTMIHIPVWQFQGGQDTNPRPHTTEQYLQNLKKVGGTPRYHLYPNLGHSVWNTAYREPDFFSWFQQYSKLTIHAFYGVSEICDVDNMSVRLGISKGFDNYEWRMTKNGETIPIASSAERPNEIVATEPGSYQVRFARGTQWTEWSEPYTLTAIERPTAEISANGSTALPGLDGSTEVVLSTKKAGVYFTWYKDEELYREGETLQSITVSEPGGYSLVVKDEGQCEGNMSNILYVSQTPYGVVPNHPQNLSAVVNSENSVNLYWEDHSDDELGFEVYRSSNGSDYTWVTTTGKDIIMYADTALTAQTTYYYKVRAYNANGASEVSSITSIVTSPDAVKPSTPANFKFDHFAYTEHRVDVDSSKEADEHFEIHTDQVQLSWSPSTDNIGVNEYKVYFSNGTLAGSTAGTSIVINNLKKDSTYNFFVIAVDDAGNTSASSNTISITTFFEGLYFNLYAGGTWDVIRNFSNWPQHGRGVHPNFSISAKDGLYDDGDDYFAFDFFGNIYITTPGEYTFYTKSDDGSQLWIGNQKVVSNDSTREVPVERSGMISLDSGVYPITVKYFDRSGGEELLVSYSGPGINKQVIPDEVLRSGKKLDNDNGVPNIPRGLIAIADAQHFRIGLSWDGQDDNTSIEIYRSKDEKTFEIIFTAPAGQTSYLDEKLDPDQTYYYKLKAVNEFGASDFSFVANATTISDTEPPSVPVNLAVQSKTTTQIALSWDHAEDNVSVKDYLVTYQVATDENPAKSKITSRNGITIDELEPQTSYTFAVFSRDGSGNTSASSERLTAETLSETALSLEFISFSYVLADNDVILKWSTKNNGNTDYFSVERSLNVNGKFDSIGEVDGTATADEPVEFEFIDTDPQQIAFYRIKQVDVNGFHSYSKILHVKLGDIFDKLTVYPNPTSPHNINLKGHVPTEQSYISITLYDTMGKKFLTVETETIRLAEGVNIGINSALHRGVYIVFLSDGTNRSQKKLIIE